jgi:hypothetical protein
MNEATSSLTRADGQGIEARAGEPPGAASQQMQEMPTPGFFEGLPDAANQVGTAIGSAETDPMALSKKF